MSGIAGVFYPHGRPAEAAEAQRMIDTIQHRGPDGGAVWTGGPVALGSRLLCTTPESLHERLPLTSFDGRLTITADARIDNRAELMAELDIAGRRAEQVTDGELILAAYARWGEDCAIHLLGDFAFAIWDARQRRLFCARDHMGLRPFYYYHSDGVFAFGTEIKAVLSAPEVPRRLNETLLAEWLSLMMEDFTHTLYRDIMRLPPAHTLTVDGQGLVLKRYWALDPARELRLGSDQEYCEAFREAFFQAVAACLRSAYPVGSMLSGGLDSSSVVVVAREVLRPVDRPLHTYSVVFPGTRALDPRCDESPYVDKIVAQGGIEPHRIALDGVDPLMDELWQDDEAFPAPNLYFERYVFGTAREQNVRVMLSGNDGDSVVYYGYEIFAELLAAGHLRKLRAEVALLSKRLRVPGRRLLWEFGLKPFVPYPLLRLGERLQRDGDAWDDRALIAPAFAAGMRVPQRIAALRAGYRRPRTARQGQLVSLESALWPWLLERNAALANRFGVESRYPFFDRRLMELCLAMPADQKLRWGLNRFVMRRALADLLPPAVQQRTDKGFLGTNFQHRLVNDERRTLDEVVLRTPEAIAGYLDLPAMRKAYGRYLASPDTSNQEAFAIFWVVVFALWLDYVGLKP